MLLDDDHLHRLATGTGPATPPRALSDVRARARQIRRTRLGVRAGGAAVITGGAVALSAGGMVSIPALFPARTGSQTAAAQSSPVPPASGSVAPVDCLSGFASPVGLAEVPNLLFLPAEGVAGDPPVLPVIARHDRRACAPTPIAAVWYALDGHTASRRLVLRGPGVHAPGGDFMGTVRTVKARGTDVHLASLPLPDGTPDLDATWTEPDGRSWQVDSRGVAAAELISIIRGLDLRGGSLGDAERPPGFTHSVAISPERQPRQVQQSFRVAFGNQNEDEGGWSVQVADSGNPIEGMGRRVKVDSAEGWWTGKGGRAGRLAWRGAGGLQFEVTGSISLRKALRVAESLAPVSVSDPRLDATGKG